MNYYGGQYGRVVKGLAWIIIIIIIIYLKLVSY